MKIKCISRSESITDGKNIGLQYSRLVKFHPKSGMTKDKIPKINEATDLELICSGEFLDSSFDLLYSFHLNISNYGRDIHASCASHCFYL